MHYENRNHGERGSSGVSLLKRFFLGAVWGGLTGLFLGIIDCIRIGLVYHEGDYHKQVSIKPYLIDCRSIFTIASGKMILFGAIIGIGIIAAKYGFTLVFRKNASRRPGLLMDLPECLFFFSLFYALSVLYCHPEPLWRTSYHLIFYILIILAVVFLLWFLMKRLVVSSFPGRKYFGYGLCGLLFILSVAILFFEIRFSGILNARAFQEESASISRTPNIILVILDTVRADHLSCYGHEKPVTPVVDRVASEGMRFNHCISSAIWTLPSHASIFTGLYPIGHQVDFSNYHLAGEFQTLAEALKRKGYQTAGFVANPIISYENNFSQGFDYFKAYGNNKITRTEFYLLGNILWQKSGLSKLFARKVYPPFSQYQRGDDLVRDMENWFRIEYRQDKPFFLFLNFMDAHYPYQVPAQFKPDFSCPEPDYTFLNHKEKSIDYFRGKYKVGQAAIEKMRAYYTLSIAYADHCLGLFLDRLRERGLYDRLALIVSSDHGEYFGGHREFYHRLFHNFGIYNELIHVPLIIRYPPSVGGGIVVEDLVQNVDIMPTILDFAGIDSLDADYPLQGRNLFDLAQSGGRRYALSQFTNPPVEDILDERQKHRVRKIYPNVDLKEWFKGYSALQDGEFKFVQDAEGREYFFNLAADPGESRDAAAGHGQEKKNMRERLKAWEQDLMDQAPKNISIIRNPEIEEKLEALGYIQAREREN